MELLNIFVTTIIYMLCAHVFLVLGREVLDDKFFNKKCNKELDKKTIGDHIERYVNIGKRTIGKTLSPIMDKITLYVASIFILLIVLYATVPELFEIVPVLQDILLVLWHIVSETFDALLVAFNAVKDGINEVVKLVGKLIP